MNHCKYCGELPEDCICTAESLRAELSKGDKFWKKVVTEAYPLYEEYVHDVLKARVVEPKLEQLLRWYEFIEWYNETQEGII